MKVNQLNSIFLWLLYACVTTMVLLQVIELSIITSILFYFTFILVFLLWFSLWKRRFDVLDLLCIFIIAVAFVNVLVNSLAENSHISFTYLKKIIMFSSSIAFFRVAEKLDITDKEIIFFKRFISIISLVFVFLYIFKYNDMHILKGRVTDYLTFKFTNPNLTAMFLFCFAVMEIIFLFCAVNKKAKIYHGGLFVILSYFIFETEARNTILAWFVFLVFIAVVLFNKKRSVYRISLPLAMMISVFPAIFFIAYFIFIDASWLTNTFSFIISTGKELTSRYTVWSGGIKAFAESPIIGAYSQISYGTGQSQLHNTHLDIMTSYGVIVFIMVCVFLSCIIYNRGVNYKQKSSFIAILGYCCVIFLGLGEAALFSGGFGLYIFAAMPLFFIKEHTQSLSGEVG